MQEKQWRKLDGRMLKDSIVIEIRSTILREKALGHSLKVCIGTDSQVKSRANGKTGQGKETEFATVIVFIRKGKGGFMYLHNETTLRKMSIKERMLREAVMSIDTAYARCRIFTLYNVDMEVHADINTNPHFKSNDALKEAIGHIMVMSARLNRSDGGLPLKPSPKPL